MDLTKPGNAEFIHIACFISPHGFGHAARASAVMLALEQLISHITFTIYTRVPSWFFSESHLTNFQYQDTLSDIGLVQPNALDEDLPATADSLSKFLPFDSTLVNDLADQIRRDGCRLVLCDISPLGIAVAKQARLPSILVENFTWDWIYAGYPEHSPILDQYIMQMREWFGQATYHIQTRPECLKVPCHLTADPVSRPTLGKTDEVRATLGIETGQKMILLTMGGIDSPKKLSPPTIERDPTATIDLVFVIPGGSPKPSRQGQFLLLPHHHGYYHPDLVNAADAVVGKLGYSTLAECYAAGVPFGYIPREKFPESQPMSEFAVQHMPSIRINPEELQSGTWLNKIPALLEQPRVLRSGSNGADQIARFIVEKCL